MMMINHLHLKIGIWYYDYHLSYEWENDYTVSDECNNDYDHHIS